MKQKTKFEITISGFVVALLLISMLASVFGIFMVQLQDNYNMTGVNSLSKYNKTSALITETQNIQNATNIKQQEGFLDVIGGYFMAGYAALKTSFNSISLFTGIMADANNDLNLPIDFGTYIVAIIAILLIVGVLIAALVKLRI